MFAPLALWALLPSVEEVQYHAFPTIHRNGVPPSELGVLSVESALRSSISNRSM